MYRTLFCSLLACALALRAEPVAVRYTEGLVHGFLVLRAANDRILADGELDQFAQGDRVTSKLVFRLLTDHLIQKGPSFPHPLDMSIDCMRQQVTVRYMDDGKEKVADEHMDLPADLANGLISILLKNVPATQSALKVIDGGGDSETSAGETPDHTNGRGLIRQWPRFPQGLSLFAEGGYSAAMPRHF